MFSRIIENNVCGLVKLDNAILIKSACLCSSLRGLN